MALEYTINFEWDSSKHYYVLKMEREVYIIKSNGKIRYYPWASHDLRWMISDRNDCAFNGEECFMHVEALKGEEEKARQIKGELKQYILKMEEE